MLNLRKFYERRFTKDAPTLIFIAGFFSSIW